MMPWLRTNIGRLAVVVILAWVLDAFSRAIGSGFIDNFFEDNLISLLIALLAINVTTVSVLLTSLREISLATGHKFTPTIKAMRGSVVEQMALLAAAAVIQVLASSTSVKANWPELAPYGQRALIAILLWAIQILYDTANSAFIIAEAEPMSDPDSTP